MQADSRPISSAQSTVHADLEKLLRRHLAQPLRKPFAAYNERALASALAAHAAWNGAAPLILDAGCGVGWSTLHLARMFPQHFVIGVDQSADRLARGKPAELPANAVLVRADLVDFWRLLARAGVRLDRHYNLYPNPWPKIGHLSRRWHGHPVFQAMLELGGILECRSNWKIYVDEFCFAVARLTARSIVTESYSPEIVLTPFERKYLNSGHVLYRAQVQL